VKNYGYTYDVDAAYGGNGPIHASYPPFQWPTNTSTSSTIFLKSNTNSPPEALWSAWGELGIQSPKEAAGGDAFGRIWFPSSQDPKTATRSYARTGHHAQAEKRTNYHLLTQHKVTKINLGSDVISAKGVEIVAVSGNTTRFSVTADREVILAAGAIHTPQILELSGIGSRKILEAAGVKVAVDLEGVGENFQDHPTNMFFFTRR